MKQLILSLLFIVVLPNVYAQNLNSYSKVIVDFVQIRNGVKTDLGAKASDLKIKNITVADSVDLLKLEYLANKAAKVKSAEKSLAHYKAQISKQKEKGGIVAEALIESLIPKLDKAEQDLKAANEWEPEYLQKYNGCDPDSVLVKQVFCNLSLMNPKVNARQEREVSFLFTPDGKTLIKAVPNKR